MIRPNRPIPIGATACRDGSPGEHAWGFTGVAKDWLVTHSAETLKAGKPVTFITFLVPHPKDVSGKTLAKATETKVTDGVATVSFTYQGETVRMTFGKKKRDWKVERTGL